MAQEPSDLNRRIDNLLCFGRIAEVDHANAKIRLDLSGRLTGWLPYPCEIGQNFRRWRPLRIGTQVLAACVSGNPANAVIVQILYTDPLPPPANVGHLDLVQFDDGTFISYDASKKLLELHSSCDILLHAPNGTIVLDAKNVVKRTGELGHDQTDNYGRVTRLTHEGGNQFKGESWIVGSVVTQMPDYGFHPPKVAAPAEPEGD
ncbi:MAG: phage baseplate assembly protein V [Alphaproteobacteria bacterium]|nr:phage baseplate assembly protein V [Alphaproteobacteria bacterium]